ncbi:DEKNAAC103706 [Brettanomyces naardenensis]|uniref:DEKNAAC103706 n=1 Tax=Brettanomyces naardenensis TaxID=13370 RepID=A0A448YN59_BRENA|nr:DEKNAAC103706 [Brettanomyces naardenensis]
MSRWYAKTNNPDYKIFLTTEKLKGEEMIEFAKSPEAGDVVYFGGTTRNSFRDKEVVSLSYEAHKGMALKTLVSLADQCMAKFNTATDRKIHKIAIAHRLGRVPTMEESVIIAISTSHREEGWQSSSWLLDRIKERAEIWKQEEYSDGSESWKENEGSNVPK